MDEKDHLRFIHVLFEFNDTASADRNLNRRLIKLRDVGRPSVKQGKEAPRKLLVMLHAFCMMPNHYHMLVSPVVKDGVSLFMKKINGGYSKYFNEKYERNGALFQGKYKKISITDDQHFSHIPYYIHFNPLDLMPENKEWRKRKATSTRGSLVFLENYRWSSHLDYIGEKNFPSVTQRDMLFDFFGGPLGYKKSLHGVLKSFSIENVKNCTLE